MKIIKFLKDSGLLIKDLSETSENELKEQKERFSDILVATLGVILLGNMLAGKAVLSAGK